MSLRLVIQPIVACILAVRAGLRDSRENKPPFFWAWTFSPDHRRELLKQGWKDIGKVFVAAAALDLVYQLVATRGLHIGRAIPIAVLLALVPYLSLRAPVTRLADWRKQHP